MSAHQNSIVFDHALLPAPDVTKIHSLVHFNIPQTPNPTTQRFISSDVTIISDSSYPNLRQTWNGGVLNIEFNQEQLQQDLQNDNRSSSSLSENNLLLIRATSPSNINFILGYQI